MAIPTSGPPGAGNAGRAIAVPHHASGARQARQRLAAELDRLGPLLPPSLRSDAEAVAAELLGNAVRHAAALPGDVIELDWRVETDAEGTIVELRVSDGGSAQMPHERRPEPDSPGGRGLTIVAALARSWGVERDGTRQCVWATLHHPVTPAAPFSMTP